MNDSGRSALARRYKGTVNEVPTWPNGDLKGHVFVLVDDQLRTAYLPHTVKNVRVGDMVELKKQAGWEVTAVLSQRPAPAVSVSMGTKPPAAATTSGSVSTVSFSITGAPVPYPAPSSGIGTTLSQLQVWATNTRAYLQNLESWTWDVRNFMNQMNGDLSSLATAVNNHAARLSSTQQTVNTNATRVNQTVDYAAGASDAMGGVVQALKDERIVK